MKKKIIIIIVGIAIVVGGYFIYDQTRFKADDIVVTFNDIKEVEYGESLDPMSLIKETTAEVTCQVKLDTSKVGKQTLVFLAKEKDVSKEFEYEIEIKDTKKPEITLTKEKETINVNDNIDVLKYIQSVKDNADGELTYMKESDIKENDSGYYTYHSDMNTKKAGSYQVSIWAVDKSQNKSEATLKVTVEEKQVTQNKPSTNTASSSGSSSGSSQSDYVANPNNRVIVIDPGHQGQGNSSKEAVGPGSSTMKAKVAAGATGVSSKKAESQINLEVGLKLRDELQARGYTVVMTRTSQNVNISNQERAKIGNQKQAAAVIHLHCDGGAASARGAHTIAPASNNPYCSSIYKASSSLAKNVIQSYSSATGISSRGVSYRNDLTGLNWSEVPAIYIEMGFISNTTEDKLLANSSFQNKCAKGIANGLDNYFR